jgi:hypothetical protein
MLKVLFKGSSVSGAVSDCAAIGMSRQRILRVYALMMGFPAGWAKLLHMETQSSPKSQNLSDEQ